MSKLTVLELLLKIAHHVGDDIILERLLPYILYLVNDPLPQVRAQALKILTQSLQLVRSMPRSDANIFPEYVLPSLSWLTQDQEVIVRIAYAENIASLAETALKFLEMAQLDFANQESNDDDDSPIQYQVNTCSLKTFILRLKMVIIFPQWLSYCLCDLGFEKLAAQQ